MFNLAINTLKEIIRNKFLYLIVVFAILFLIFSIFLWQISLWEDNKIIIDFWIAMIEIFSIMWVLFVWSQLLFKEIEWKTIFLILTKPIKRYEFVLWKFFGFAIVLFLIFFLQSLLYFLILYINNIQITYLIVLSLFFIFIKILIFIWIVLFLSTFVSNIWTIVLSMLFYFASHSFSLVLDLVKNTSNTFLIYFVQLLNLLFPPFEALNIKNYIWSFVQIENSFLIYNFLYWIIYLVLILFFTNLIFNRKTFEN